MSDEHRCPFTGNNIRILRAQRNWTLRRLAEKAGIPLNTAWRLEHGMSAVLANAMNIAFALDSTVYEVWDIPGPRIIPWVGRAKGKGNKLRELRIQRGWTLQDLSRRSLVPTSTLAQIERDTGPTLGNAVRIAAAFGLSVYDIWSIPEPGSESLRAQLEPASKGAGNEDEISERRRDDR